MPLTDAGYAYVAGFVDGEGCIRFGVNRGRSFPMLLITHTNREILEYLREQFGGDVRESWGRKPGWKTSWMWRLSNTKVSDLLDRLYPWLRVKRRHAETVFAWFACRPGMGRDWDAETTALLLDRMEWLNRKGPNEDPDPILKEFPNATVARIVQRG